MPTQKNIKKSAPIKTTTTTTTTTAAVVPKKGSAVKQVVAPAPGAAKTTVSSKRGRTTAEPPKKRSKNDEELKNMLQDIISGQYDPEDEEIEEDEDISGDDDVNLDFDDDEDDDDEELEEDDEELEDDDEELEGEEEEEDDEYGVDQDEEIDPDELDDLYQDVYEEGEDDEDEDEDEEEDEEEIDAPIAIPTKKLTKELNITGKSFQGFANVADILAAQKVAGKQKPAEMIREMTEVDELALPTSDLSENEEEESAEKDQEIQQEPIDYNKHSVNDKVGLTQKLQDFKLMVGGKVPWVHTLTVTTKKQLECPNIHDDFVREMAFYKQTLDSVMVCESLCKDFKLPVERKPDYYAEMVKTDQQMYKIKAKLDEDKKRIEKADLIRQKRQFKKIGKQVQVQKQQERQKEKSSQLEAVKKWRKNREKGNVSEDFSIDLIDEEAKKGNNGGNNKRKRDLPTKGKKRLAKDEKYGFGGKKKFAKSNTRESTDAGSFSVKRNNSDLNNHYKEKAQQRKAAGGFGGKAGSGGKAGFGGKAGGKSRPAKMFKFKLNKTKLMILINNVMNLN
ncbi:hypothetical protein PPL_06021 [Heterostelium album PN500]|uniref:rRNA-processing protein EBP2 n=1 Tax=Heterostelium pallidum (strain ATCC 26659 / Pp 5 / PN500) TaxID=670386 RepID=D3BC01_HETP5|nr:hypothetical protein PPL_06021 [Heterostelium album PN500]EFA81184.1 hypothetical protein PPL_06021 [Heterostelium album PN500]|eukprot:XP_020433302.1 hypothetical protein PPL_06021 [Heterostelium album PN500]